MTANYPKGTAKPAPPVKLMYKPVKDAPCSAREAGLHFLINLAIESTGVLRTYCAFCKVDWWQIDQALNMGKPGRPPRT